MKRDCDGYRLVDDIDMLVQPLTSLHAVISDYLEDVYKRQRSDSGNFR